MSRLFPLFFFFFILKNSVKLKDRFGYVVHYSDISVQLFPLSFPPSLSFSLSSSFIKKKKREKLASRESNEIRVEKYGACVCPLGTGTLFPTCRACIIFGTRCPARQRIDVCTHSLNRRRMDVRRMDSGHAIGYRNIRH